MTDRDRRMAELQAQMQHLREQIAPLSAEWLKLDMEKAREEWPDGPFTLHYMRYYSEETDEFDRPWEAVSRADSIEDAGTGAPVKITDRHGTTIYDLSGWPGKTLVDGYPDIETLRR